MKKQLPKPTLAELEDKKMVGATYKSLLNKKRKLDDQLIRLMAKYIMLARITGRFVWWLWKKNLLYDILKKVCVKIIIAFVFIYTLNCIGELYFMYWIAAIKFKEISHFYR